MNKEYTYVIIAAILYGTITSGAQYFVNIGLSLFEIAIYRALFTSLILLPAVLLRNEYLVKKEMILFFAIYGLIGALLELTMFGAISLGVPVAIVALLLYTQPIWTIIFGRLMLNEKITKTKIIALIIAIFGIFLLFRSWEIKSIESLVGIIASLLSGVLLSLWVIWGRKSLLRNQHIITTTFGWTGFSVIWLLLLWPFSYVFIEDPIITNLSYNLPFSNWIYLVAYALIGGVIPHLLFFRGFRIIEASVAGILLLLEPVSAAILAMIFFKQVLGIDIIMGGALILLSNYFVIRESKDTIHPL